MSTAHTPSNTQHVVLVAVYAQEILAQQTISQLQEQDAPMDMLSIIGKVHASGDDLLGISYHNIGEQVQTWAKQGALWGALWGMLTGVAMFLIPGGGALIVGGSIVETLAGVIAAGGIGSAVGGTLAATTMAGAAVMSHLSTAMHHQGIPPNTLTHLHQAIEDGQFVLMLRVPADQTQPWQDILAHSAHTEILTLPYHGMNFL